MQGSTATVHPECSAAQQEGKQTALNECKLLP